ncbi:Rieske (2Fe-2S) protein [Paenibacillus alginolyticus]|uniref:Rieske (2Fe-2S) protein n=1 Tax=Paenibacillus alginolyticus TaxID=59839 RepID=A0ABT4GPM6_9BACL|nr:Rieske (2Fe-2S) protein [Paenibacillus alginolyticus]MCY9698171.1 Rieske (2Fe-2S) protein [Paenibacillus alginolyticus]MEC0146717.1 Rieske (2Fe-2S) protein [Paenibacillus alginolyticus]
MALHYIGGLEEFPEGDRKIIEVKGRSIGIFHLSDKLHAVLNYCPHQGAQLCEGMITPWVHSSRPGQFEYEKEGEIIKCPWHGWEYDIRTGCLIVEGKIRTKTYDITVETFDLSLDKGKVYIDL